MTPPPDPQDRLPGALRAMWPNLPAVAACGVLVCAGFLPAILLGSGLTPVGVVLAALGAGPAWAAVVCVADRVAGGQEAEVRHLLRALRRHGPLGLRVAAPAAGCAACTLVTLEAWQQTHARWLLGPLATGTAGVVLALLATVPAYPLAIRIGLRGRVLWGAAVEQVVAAPLVPLGVVAAAGLGLWLLGLAVSASFLLLVPGPLAVVLCAATPDPGRGPGPVMRPRSSNHGKAMV